jgi:hypothetical protein
MLACAWNVVKAGFWGVFAYIGRQTNATVTLSQPTAIGIRTRQRGITEPDVEERRQMLLARFSGVSQSLYAVSTLSAGFSALSWSAACAATSLATGILKALQLT